MLNGGLGFLLLLGREGILVSVSNSVTTMSSTGLDSANNVAETLASIRTESGASLLELTEASPVLLVFLRHFGCSFCRQAISDVADLKDELAKRGVRPVFVHLGTPERAKPFFDYYGIGDVERVERSGGEGVSASRCLRCRG